MRYTLLLLLVLGGCKKSPVEPIDPQTGSETHWLQSCAADQPDCACVCGVCTAVCDDADACTRGKVSGRCVAAGSKAAEAMCGVAPTPRGLCAAGCAADVDCGDGLACAEGVCVEPAPPEPVEVGDVFEVPDTPRVDYLFVIDNSGSMCDEQRTLAQGFDAIAASLLDGNDFRVAVVSTDGSDDGGFLRRPAPPTPSINCADERGEPAAPDTADCLPLIESDELPAVLRPDAAPDEATLSRQFRCLATLGTEGDGFEAGLEAMRRALSCEGPNAERFGACCGPDGVYDATLCDDPAFLRPDADLAVVFLTDEDDCSQPISRSENDNCEWDRAELPPVDAYAAFLDTLKPDPRRQIGVTAIVGPELRTASGAVVRFDRGMPEPGCDARDDDFDLDRCCADGRCVGRVAAACESDLGNAFTGHRYLDLASRYQGCGPAGGCSICAGDLAAVVSDAVEGYSFVRDDRCLEDRPLCAVTEGEAVRPCETPEEAADPTNLVARVEVWCEGPRCEAPFPRRALAPEAWSLAEDPTCDSGVRLDTEQDWPRGTRLHVRYRTTLR